ncbi:NAD(P)H-dependent oxidoreductase [Psychroserpens ponticola]|uniref:NAD(P)H-dependent oxidoreductase n=1 Tax=Psychroserpens ponticola TaxID=2932268 RepID=A0ABY7RYQ8_9FLAO|nr:NAD(P)H-dependent oxidoreductase [Psychroserpens ponticola]WCO02294.1 NAD(P)H-dependent oxidoreductase [Psychroserpens ponticola]
MNLINNLEWRYATKKFDTSKKVSTENLEQIKKAIQLSASSYGLQLYKVLIIDSKEIREKLKSASYGQTQITEASHLVIFCNYSIVTEEHIDEYFALKSQIEQVNVSDLKDYSDFIKEDINNKSKIEKDKWTSNQTYLALGNLLNACAELKIDACPMEGFERGKYNEILSLEEQGLNTSVIATIGYRSDNDTSQHTAKVRKPTKTLFA